MLADQIQAVVTEFVRRRVPFSHRDVADQIPDLGDARLDEVRQIVFEQMVRVPSYRLSLARFVGEGPTLMCIPVGARAGASLPAETPAVESGRLVA